MRYKKPLRKMFAYLLIFVLTLSFGAPTSVFAFHQAVITEAEATDLSDALDYDWKVAVSGSELTLEVRDARAGLPLDEEWRVSAYLTGRIFAGTKFSGTHL